jgi:hypothetical protein
MIDDRGNDEEREADAEAPADQLFLDRQQRLGLDFAQLGAKIRFRHDGCPFGLTGERRLDAAEEEPGDQQPNPDNKAEQAHEIDRGKFADPVLPELAEVGEDADREKVRVKKIMRKVLASAIAGVSLLSISGEAQIARARPVKNVTTKPIIFGETLPNFRSPRGVALPHVDMVGPDIGEDERPDPDEDLDCGGCPKHPAGLNAPCAMIRR